MREYRTPAMAEIPPSANLADVVFERAEREPQAEIMRRKVGRGQGWQPVTAGQFRDDVTAIAKGLVAAGIGVGDRVALLSRTCYQWTVTDYAIWSAGAVTVPIYETSSAEQVEWILSDSGARALIVETGHEQVISDVLSRLPAIKQVWLIEAASSGGSLSVGAAPAGSKPLDTLASDGAAIDDAELTERRAACGASDLATIVYTSGTTGRPKGCRLTHANLLADVSTLGHVVCMPDILHRAHDAIPPIGAMLGRNIQFIPLHRYAASGRYRVDSSCRWSFNWREFLS